jgi:hypothetical protein
MDCFTSKLLDNGDRYLGSSVHDRDLEIFSCPAN